MNSDTLIAAAARLLNKDENAWNPASVRISSLTPDGSIRRFFRLEAPGEAPLIAILPPEDDEAGQAEAKAFFHIGRHLRQSGTPVPEVHAYDPENGMVLCEDLGNQRLHDRTPGSWERRGPKMELYCQALRRLARMQVRAAEGFEPSWCWDTPRYDRALMMETESGYFLRACCTHLLGLSYDREAVEAECAQLAEAAAEAPAGFFLHRDFQSRNIMLRDESPCFIDFQGGRLGPLAYDVASLLLDPYAALPLETQDYLREVYLRALREETDYPAEQFLREYRLLALQRNLQILGAFAFLSQVRKKAFFAQFLHPALLSLDRLLGGPEGAGYTHLRHLCRQCLEESGRQP